MREQKTGVKKPADIVQVRTEERPAKRRHAQLSSSQNCPRFSMVLNPKELF